MKTAKIMYLENLALYSTKPAKFCLHHMNVAAFMYMRIGHKYWSRKQASISFLCMYCYFLSSAIYRIRNIPLLLLKVSSTCIELYNALLTSHNNILMQDLVLLIQPIAGEESGFS